MGRILSANPVGYRFVSYRFRDKLGAALAAAAAGVIGFARQNSGSDILNVQDRVDLVIGIKEGFKTLYISR